MYNCSIVSSINHFNMLITYTVRSIKGPWTLGDLEGGGAVGIKIINRLFTPSIVLCFSSSLLTYTCDKLNPPGVPRFLA